MDRHGPKCQIGGTDARQPMAIHRLRRLEVAMSKDPVKWRKKRPTSLQRAAPVNKKEEKKKDKKKKEPPAASRDVMMTSAISLTAGTGMGNLSQKKVDEYFLEYLNG